MIGSKMLIAGGLMLTLGAFSPALAQTSSNKSSHSANYSDSSDKNASGRVSADQQDQNPTLANDEVSGDKIAAGQENSSAQNQSDEDQSADAQASENAETEAQSSEAQSSQDKSSENQDRENQLSSSRNAANPAALAQMEDRIQRQIHHLNKDLSDAQQYVATARDDWNYHDIAGAQRNFRIAEHILSMATGGRNFGPAMLTENPHEQEMTVERAIKHAKASGADVSDAQHFLDQGREALNSGNRTQASQDFRAAELSLGIPVEVGYAEVWESEIPNPGQQANAHQEESSEAASQEENGTEPVYGATNQQKSWESNQGQAEQKREMTDAELFLHDGERALKNGNKEEAQEDFRAARRALSMAKEAANDSMSSSSSETSNTTAENQ